MKTKAWVGMVVAGVLASGAAQAALVDRGGGLIYDSDQRITWLQDANLAVTNTFGVNGVNADGSMNWATASRWIAAMNAVNYLGYTNWRLPTSLNPDGSGPCGGYYCTSSEMGHLYYTGGGLSAGQSINDSVVLNSLFVDMQSDVYWSSTAYAPDPAIFAWIFYNGFGNQSGGGQSSPYYVWAVRDGDVGAAVPEPATLALTFASLGLAGLARRRRGLRAA